MEKLGGISRDKNSWVFRFGNSGWDNYIYETFRLKDYGTLAKAKAAALAYQKKLQPKLKELKYGATAKKYGVSVEEWLKKSEKERFKYAMDVSNKRTADAKRKKDITERTFKYKNKTYVAPVEAPKKVISNYKNFIKYITDYIVNRKPGVSILESVQNIPAYKNEPVVNNKRAKWHKEQGRLFQDLSEYFLKGKKGNYRIPSSFTFFENIDIKNLISPKDHQEVAKLKSNRVAQALTRGTPTVLKKGS